MSELEPKQFAEQVYQNHEHEGQVNVSEKADSVNLLADDLGITDGSFRVVLQGGPVEDEGWYLKGKGLVTIDGIQEEAYEIVSPYTDPDTGGSMERAAAVTKTQLLEWKSQANAEKLEKAKSENDIVELQKQGVVNEAQKAVAQAIAGNEPIETDLGIQTVNDEVVSENKLGLADSDTDTESKAIEDFKKNLYQGRDPADVQAEIHGLVEYVTQETLQIPNKYLSIVDNLNVLRSKIYNYDVSQLGDPVERSRITDIMNEVDMIIDESVQDQLRLTNDIAKGLEPDGALGRSSIALGDAVSKVGLQVDSDISQKDTALVNVGIGIIKEFEDLGANSELMSGASGSIGQEMHRLTTLLRDGMTSNDFRNEDTEYVAALIRSLEELVEGQQSNLNNIRSNSNNINLALSDLFFKL